jgi:7-carboxy-7-deazaguanine synthase
MSEYLYSEIFNSVQGEGHYTGVPTAWVRFFLCNLQCNGFGQDDPTDPLTYDLPYQKIDLHDITEVEQLPVFEKGCDSSYSWSKKFKHLMHRGTAENLVERIVDVLRTPYNPKGYFRHPNSNQVSHLCFTGGEPLMPQSQKAVVEIIQHLKLQHGGYDGQFHRLGNLPKSVTFETNGTQELTDQFKTFFGNRGLFSRELFFSVSPKLWTVSGEKAKKAIKPDVVKEYYEFALRVNQRDPIGQLKFVVGSKKEQWEEMESVVDQFRQAGVHWPVWVMPLGARVEEQEASAGDIAVMALERGYNVSARVHTYLFGNAIGT